jgi:hypothetical protein
VQRLPLRLIDAEPSQHALLFRSDVGPVLPALAADMRGKHRLRVAALIVNHAGDAGQLEEDAFHPTDQARGRVGNVVHRHHVTEPALEGD